MIVRPATHADIPRIVEMSEAFYPTTEYVKTIPLDSEWLHEFVALLIDGHVFLVAEAEGKVCGMVALSVAPFIFNPLYKQAQEVVWWVDGEVRSVGAGKALLKAIPDACKAHEVDRIVMVHLSNSPPQAAQAYEAMGYAYTESCYTQDIQEAA